MLCEINPTLDARKLEESRCLPQGQNVHWQQCMRQTELRMAHNELDKAVDSAYN
ncbi:MAG: hypothetical protein WBI40_08285 [Methylococcaceae bacterium]